MRIAGLIGSNVSAISNERDFERTFDTSSLQSLLQCPHLRILELATKPRFASEQATIVTQLRSLREFTVTSWNIDHIEPTTVIEFAPGAVLGIAKALPALEKLHLRDTRISNEEIVGVLEELRTRLVCFEASAQEQAERFLERAESLLCAAIRFNPRLKHFDIPDIAFCFNAESVDISEIPRLKVLMKMLQTVAPLIEMAVLSGSLKTLEIEQSYRNQYL